MDALKVLKERRSARQYLPDMIPKEIIKDIIDCGRLAATALNKQPWEFVAITDKKKREYIADVVENSSFINDAPTCIGIFCENSSEYKIEDCSAATENILLAAKAYGLSSCWIAGYNKPYTEQVQNILKVPEKYELFSLVTVGYGKEDDVSKKEVEQVLHWEEF